MKKVRTIWHAVAIVMGMYLVFIVSVMACASTTRDNEVDMNKVREDQIARMESSINYLESVLDSVEAHFPLLDTVGEGDTYFDLCETRNAFNYCRTYEDKLTHYKVYRQQFDDVMDEIMTTLAEYDDSVTFDMVRSMYNNDSWWCKMHE
jgi:hypothetical protein